MNRAITWLWGRLPLGIKARQWIIWTLSPKYTVGVVGLVRDTEGRVLILKHTYRPREPWGLPGGGLRSGETLEQCLRREVREEACIEVEVGHLLSAAAHVDRRLVDMIFECRPLPGQSLDTFKANAEISEARFVSPDGLPPNMPTGQRRLLQTALSQIGESETFHFRPETGEWP